MTLYLENMNFLIESVDKLKKKKINKRLKNIKNLYCAQFLQNTFLFQITR